MKRDHISKEQVLLRIGKQMDDEEKIKRCDFVIINDEQQLVTPQVMDLHKKLTELAVK
jgi:dephospho-CoA kinase